MDNMEITKIGGALCGALLIYFLVNWAGEIMYHTGGGHGEGDQASYVIEVPEEASAIDEEIVPMAELVAAADAGKGKKVFSKCKACHKIEAGANGVGPTLFAIVDRSIGTEAGYAFSPVLANKGGNWTLDSLNAFITKPKDFAPGTKMGFAGLKKSSDRANLISYLQTLGQ